MSSPAVNFVPGIIICIEKTMLIALCITAVMLLSPEAGYMLLAQRSNTCFISRRNHYCDHRSLTHGVQVLLNSMGITVEEERQEQQLVGDVNAKQITKVGGGGGQRSKKRLLTCGTHWLMCVGGVEEVGYANDDEEAEGGQLQCPDRTSS